MSETRILPTVGSVEEIFGEIIIHRAPYGQGYVYKNWKAYQSGKGICYVPELSDTTYDRNDFVQLCNGQYDIAQEVFESVDWQHPETYLDELFRDEEIDICESCGKWFWSYGLTECPHCHCLRKKEGTTA